MNFTEKEKSKLPCEENPEKYPLTDKEMREIMLAAYKADGYTFVSPDSAPKIKPIYQK